MNDDFLLQEASRDGKRRSRLLRLIPVVVVALVVVASASAEVEPFTWSTSFLLAPASFEPGTSTGYRLNAVSCATPSLCVSVDTSGNAVTSTEPAAGGEAWTPMSIDSTALDSIACPLESLCVAGDDEGRILTSSDPGARGATWSSGVVTTNPIEDISCAGGTLCVASDLAGEVLSSTAPFLGFSSWHAVSVDPVGAPLTGVSCASRSLCVAVDSAGNVWSSTEPSGPASSWHAVAIDEERALLGVSCPAASYCVVVDGEGNVFVSTDPTGAAAEWAPAGNTGEGLPQSLSCPDPDRCVALQSGSAAVSDDPGEPGSWLSSAFPAAHNLRSVTCPAVTFCLAVDSTGHAMSGLAAPPSGSLELEIAGSGEGTVTGAVVACKATCTSVFPRGTPLTLTASPAAGSSFLGWTGACAGSAPCTVTVQHSTVLTATFARVPQPAGFTLTISISGSGTVTGPGLACPPRCRPSLTAGSSTRLTAKPAPGWRFAHWGGACSGRSSCSVQAGENLRLSASFEHTGAGFVIVRRVKVDAHRHTATVIFSSSAGHSRTYCALRRLARRSRLRYRGCRSPATYRYLARGSYRVYVRTGVAHASPSSRTFSIP